jgi:RHS repeat-associated protein
LQKAGYISHTAAHGIKVDDLRIFKKGLNPEEVQILYTNTAEPAPAPNPQEVLAAKSGGYRYGFQGQERMDEVKGAGNSWDYKYRMHDARLGRFFAVDPLFKDYPFNSNYAFCQNRVVDMIELEGAESFRPYLLQPFGGLMHLAKVSDELQVQKLKHPTSGDIANLLRASWSVSLNNLHTGLDLIGLIPALGEPADLTNGVLYSLSGNGTDATLSFAAAVPFAGYAATTTKWAKNVLKFSDNAFHSSSGLAFKLGSKHGNRLSHVMEHTVDDLTKKKHGVFTLGDDLLSSMDEAYSRTQLYKWNDKLAVGQSETLGGITRTIRQEPSGLISENFVVDMGKKIGYEGGSQGSKAALNKIQISLEKGTSDVLTSFPTK